jgi:ABC-type dipeptide/oligopeptide/nickel transport system permease component
VSRLIGDALSSTLALAVAATAVTLISASVLGTAAALARWTGASNRLDGALMTLALAGLSTPVAFSGLVAILFFSLFLGWLPATGQGSIRHLILPALVLGWASAGGLARLVRDQVLTILDEPYITAARARGVPRFRLIWLHTGRVALPNLLAMLALQIGFLLGGTVITESVFARRGLGRVAVEAVLNQDLPVIQGVVLLGVFVYSITNLVADVTQLRLDPRLVEEMRQR